MRVSLLVVALISSANAFTAPTPQVHRPTVDVMTRFSTETENEGSVSKDLNLASKVAGISATFWAASSQISAAAGPDWGIFEGRTGSLLHPIMMAGLLLTSLYTGFLGFRWREQRTIGDSINELKKSIPDLQGAASVSAALEAATSAEKVDTARVNALTTALSVEKEIKDLQERRKQLASENNRDKHYSNGALLAFLGTAFAIEGPLNTYARAGKLFPGPHLYAGAGLVVLWALAASTVPFMQKGNDTARTIHIGANIAGISLFLWQVVSGIPILLKVIEKTSWP